LIACAEITPLSRRSAREDQAMRGADKVVCQAATLFLLFALSTAPANAQFGGFGGGADMMTQMAPMLEMMKAKMGKRRFAMLMQTMGPMMARMMENGGFGGMGAGIPGGFGGATPGGLGSAAPGGYGGATPDGPAMSGGFGGGDVMGMLGGAGGADIMAMIPQLMRLANLGGRSGLRHQHRRRD
jgi:hypothetical protein